MTCFTVVAAAPSQHAVEDENVDYSISPDKCSGVGTFDDKV